MKRPSFLEGVGIALVLALGSAAIYAVLPAVFGWDGLLRALIAGLGLTYILYLLKRSGERVGRVTVTLFWIVAAVGLWMLHVPLTLYVLAHAGAVWFIRSLYYHGGLVPALMDLAIAGFGVITAFWAVIETSSLFLAVWCFFLCQALFTAIPKTIRTSPTRPATDDPFERAHRAGQSALRAFTSSPSRS